MLIKRRNRYVFDNKVIILKNKVVLLSIGIDGSTYIILTLTTRKCKNNTSNGCKISNR